MKLVGVKIRFDYGYTLLRKGVAKRADFSFSVTRLGFTRHIWDCCKGLLERYIGAPPITGGATRNPEKIGTRVYEILCNFHLIRFRKEHGIIVPLYWQTGKIKDITIYQLKKWREKLPPYIGTATIRDEDTGEEIVDEDTIKWGLYVPKTYIGSRGRHEATIEIVALWYQELPSWEEWGTAIAEAVVPKLSGKDRATALLEIAEGMKA